MTPAIIDIVAVAVLAIFTVLGARKGLLRTLAGVLVVVFSLAGAGIIASALSAPAAKLIAPAIEKRVELRLEEAMQEELSGSPLKDDPSALEDHLSIARVLELLGVDESRWEALALQATGTIQETGTRLVTAVIESVARSILYGVLYMISFFLLTILLHLLVRMADAFLTLPGLHGLNAAGGGLLGLAEGALVLWTAVWVLRLLGVSLDSRIFHFFTAHALLEVFFFSGV